MKKLLLLLLLIPNLVMAENVFYCQDKLATGIQKRNGVWKTYDFSLERYTIKFNDDYTKLDGLDPFLLKCSLNYKNLKGEENRIFCTTRFGWPNFTFDTLSMRYTYAQLSPSSYVENGSDTAHFSAGTCKAF